MKLFLGSFSSLPLNHSRRFRKRGLVASLDLSSCCLVMVERLFLAVPSGFLRFVIVVFPDHTHLLFLLSVTSKSMCTKYWLTACSSLPRKKCCYVN